MATTIIIVDTDHTTVPNMVTPALCTAPSFPNILERIPHRLPVNKTISAILFSALDVCLAAESCIICKAKSRPGPIRSKVTSTSGSWDGVDGQVAILGLHSGAERGAVAIIGHGAAARGAGIRGGGVPMIWTWLEDVRQWAIALSLDLSIININGVGSNRNAPSIGIAGSLDNDIMHKVCGCPIPGVVCSPVQQRARILI
jgi:hypothetical protein